MLEVLNPFNKAIIVYKPVNECIKLVESAIIELKRHNVEVFVLTVDDISSVKEIPPTDLGAVDLVVSIGGDGTFMRSAKAFSSECFVLPYPCGRRNVYYESELPSVDSAIRDVLRGLFFLEFLPKQSVCYEQKCAYFLNDVVVVSTDLGKVSKYTIEITSLPTKSCLTFEGDGVIISTAGGSSGHNLSARGPMVTPTLETLVITPINPLQVGITSIVIPAFAKVSIRVKNRAYVYIDGDLFLVLERNSSIDLPGRLSYVKVIRLKAFRDPIRAVFETRKHIF